MSARLYANDTVLYLPDRNVTNLASRLNNCLDILNKWCCANRLTVNVSKTKAMLFGKNAYELTKNQHLNLTLAGALIGYVQHFTYLGVTLECDLKFNAHISCLISSCNLKIHTLSNIRKFITEDIAVKLYKALNLSVLDYGDVFYDCASRGVLDQLQKLQNCALRIACLAPRHTSNLFLNRKHKILPLYMRRE